MNHVRQVQISACSNSNIYLLIQQKDAYRNLRK